MERKSQIEEIVANADVIQSMTQDEDLIGKYNQYIAQAKDGAGVGVEEFTFCRRFLMMQILYR